MVCHVEHVKRKTHVTTFVPLQADTTAVAQTPGVPALQDAAAWQSGLEQATRGAVGGGQDPVLWRRVHTVSDVASVPHPGIGTVVVHAKVVQRRVSNLASPVSPCHSPIWHTVEPV
eukprot:CAMPEP_0185762712 /NCGR_PEP_ID=MMETSP1174-20130828/21677_1 /TAXON_ID=35687 /ORGANISM="Dictyocha speculum, Strain CCMP1381" /LENGTH=115 /DNA_ID=CAMNT_0028444497 /DNA_START=273 /DNA_END=621 /DNA_ORIENTATION=-